MNDSNPILQALQQDPNESIEAISKPEIIVTPNGERIRIQVLTNDYKEQLSEMYAKDFASAIQVIHIAHAWHKGEEAIRFTENKGRLIAAIVIQSQPQVSVIAVNEKTDKVIGFRGCDINMLDLATGKLEHTNPGWNDIDGKLSDGSPDPTFMVQYNLSEGVDFRQLIPNFESHRAWADPENTGRVRALGFLGLFVLKQYERLGIATRMIQKSMRLARAERCVLAKTDTVSVYSERLFKKLGFRAMNTLEYKHYLDPNGRRYFECTDGSERAILYASPLV